MTRIEMGFKFFKDLIRAEITADHCPHEIDENLPDMDIRTYKLDADVCDKGCRGITCDECWDKQYRKHKSKK